MKAALYARVSTYDQQTLGLQTQVMTDYVQRRGWQIVLQVQDTASAVSGGGPPQRKRRELIMQAARRREVDVVVVWKLDRWGRSLADLMHGLQELNALKVGFVSITEALDLTIPSGRALAGMLAVFAEFERDILRERVKAGIAYARQQGKPHGRPKTAALKAKKVKELFEQGCSKAQIARELDIGRTSVRRLLSQN